MLDRLGGFYSYAITDIWTLVGVYYAFGKRLDTSSYVADLLYKDKFLCDDIENMSNGRPCCEKSCFWVNKTTNSQVQERFLAFIIVNANVGIF